MNTKFKVIDTFMFFQELDLLEIRLNYLNDYVDIFVIVEACQTHSGKKKDFVFEKNKERFKKYLKKIEYYKINDYHFSFDSVIKQLEKNNNSLSFLIANNFKKRTNLPKDHPSYLPIHMLNWVLDNYHRESILFPLQKVSTENDIVLLSDLDEIPHVSFFSEENKKNILNKPRACIQHEFTYFLNYYKNSNWIGTIGGNFKDMTRNPLNILRVDRLFFKKIIHKSLFKNGGYHFTTVGTNREIINKIESYSHQELNNNAVKKNLEENIKLGKDPFSRDNKRVFYKICINDHNYFDKKMSAILSKYKHLIANDKIIEDSETFILKNVLIRTQMKISGKIFELKNKIKYFFISNFINRKNF